jgi:hypothetical protein
MDAAVIFDDVDLNGRNEVNEWMRIQTTNLPGDHISLPEPCQV